ncbi:MAG: hypothetical protein LKJ88_08185 [Bacilli bacterium]|jgi:hypothetical protein|nr:hypothetical protein [Bacilli bacterium]
MLSWLFPLLGLTLGLIILILPSLLFNAKEEKYSFLRYFPCELASSLKGRIILLTVCLLFSFASSLAFVYNLINCRSGLFITSWILEALSLFAFIGVLLYGLDNYKAHIIADAIFFVGEAGGDLALLFALLFSQGRHYDFNETIQIIFGVIGFFLVCLFFLPKLKRWSYLEKSEENGKVVYVRPKVSPLALLEWVFFLGQLINQALLLISSLIAG